MLLGRFFKGCEFALDFAVDGNTLRRMGRRVGRQAAMMMRAFSAPAVRRSSPTSKVGSRLVALALSLVHLMIAMDPALKGCFRTTLMSIVREVTYNTPRLIAMATPNFSLLFMLRFHSIAQGKRARIKSVAAE